MKRLTFLALATLAAPLIAQDEYEIRFERLHRVQGKMAMEAKFSMERAQTVSVDNHLVKEEKVDVSGTISGELEIVAAGPKGTVTAVKFKVSAAKATKDGKEAALFKAGDVIESASVDKKEPVVKVNGVVADETQAEAANIFLPVNRGSDVTCDEVFGPGKKVKVGDEWPVNSKAAAKDTVEDGVKGVVPENFSGTGQLTKMEDVDGMKCLRVVASVTLKAAGMEMPWEEFPMKVKSMLVDTFHDAQLPVALDEPPVWQKMAVIAATTAGGTAKQDDEELRVDFSTHSKEALEVRLKLLK